MRPSTKARISAASVSTSSFTPAQQHALADHEMPGVDQPRAGGARRRRQFARMVGVQRDIDRLAVAAQSRDQSPVTRSGVERRDAGVQAQDFDMIELAQPRVDLGEPARREHQRIAAGEDHLPDLLDARAI